MPFSTKKFFPKQLKLSSSLKLLNMFCISYIIILVKSAPKPVTVSFSGAECLFQSDEVLAPMDGFRDELVRKEESHFPLVGVPNSAPEQTNASLHTFPALDCGKDHGCQFGQIRVKLKYIYFFKTEQKVSICHVC